jgi:hypothetical protein
MGGRQRAYLSRSPAALDGMRNFHIRRHRRRFARFALWTVIGLAAGTPGTAAAHSGHPARPASDAGPAGPAPSWGLVADLMRVAAATARYHDVDRAIADGYRSTGTCFSSALGGMGIHYVKPDIEGDAISDLTEPELLLYDPSPHGRPRLVGVEYLQPDLGQARPAMMGQPFDGPMTGHFPGQPTHYDLHIWIWRLNPRGLFSPWNPRVSC